MWLCGSCGFCGSCVSNIRQTRSTSRFARFWSLWILCGSCVGGFVVFGHVWFLALVCASDRAFVVFVVFCRSCGFLPSTLATMPVVLWSCGLVVLWSCGLVVLPRCPWSCPRFRCLPVVLRVHLPAGIARPLGEGLCGSVVLPSIPMPMLMLRIARPLARRACASDCASSCSLWFGGLALDAEADGCASTCPQVFVDRWSCPRCRSR